MQALGESIFGPSLPSPAGDPRHVLLELSDYLGSTHAALDAQTGEVVEMATYQAQGAIESDYRPERWGAFREELKFTGKEEDIELGIDYFGARYYHPRLGRWMSPDPLTIHRLAAARNPYSYVHGQLLSEVDPAGLAGQPDQDPDARDRNGCIGDDETCGIRREAGGTGTVTIPDVTIVGQVPGDSEPQWLTDYMLSGTWEEEPYETGDEWEDLEQSLLSTLEDVGGAIVDAALSIPLYLLGEPNTTSLEPTDAGYAIHGGQRALNDTDQLISIAEQEVTGALVGKTFSLVTRGELRPVTAEASHLCIPPDCPCFAAGTAVQTPSGPRAIESLEVGDLVLSKDEASGEVAPRRVLNRYVTPDTEVMQVELRAGKDEPERITVTPAHPFWVTDKGWVAASALETGDQLL